MFILVGVVSMKKRLDYETKRSSSFSVEVADTGTPQLKASATVYVSVLNINDHGPVFDEVSSISSCFD